MQVIFRTHKKIKLPRKRKKAFIKSHSHTEYLAMQIVGELLLEDGKKWHDRFYDMRRYKTKEEYHKFGEYVPIKRW